VRADERSVIRWTEVVNAPGFVRQRGVNREAILLVVSRGFFRTMGTPMLHGRDFDERDHEQAPRVAIVNEAMARYYFRHSFLPSSASQPLYWCAWGCTD
jgi:hypothetical protein